MKLICYSLEGKQIDVQAASAERSWIDDTRDQFAKRCLPLMVANAHGWQIRLIDGCRLKWNGGNLPGSLKVETDSGTDDVVVSHFGNGIVTFKVHCLFRTDPGINLWVTGPVNSFKDGVQAISGLLETDWMPYTFTMNWKMTRKRKWIRFEKGDPIAQLFPVPRGIVDTTEPKLRRLADDEALNEMVLGWQQSRREFIDALKARDPAALNQIWQKDYFRGQYPDGSPGCAEHQTRIRPKPFKPD
ncbi:MAG: DUF6065 family protein [Anderseniella sp.]